MRIDHLVTKVEAGRSVRLNEIDPGLTTGVDRSEAERRLLALDDRLDELQELLYAAGKNAVLIILQGMDTSGKDGTIRHVFAHVNPLACRAYAFKAPTEEEAAHDFLWRVHQRTPIKGSLAIFNRSHYEDVLVARVRGLAPESVWKQRYEQINQFEAQLAASETIILKFFLHVSKDEQRKRLLERERDRDKGWKLAASDWDDRRLWSDYQAAYEDVFRLCSCSAPWYIVPSDRKWFRNVAIASILTETLEHYAKDWKASLESIGRKRLAELARLRLTQAGKDWM